MHFCSFLVNFPGVPQSSFPSTPTSCSTPTNSAVPERSGTIEDSELMGDDIDSLLDCVSTEPETAEVNSKCCVFFLSDQRTNFCCWWWKMMFEWYKCWNVSFEWKSDTVYFLFWAAHPTQGILFTFYLFQGKVWWVLDEVWVKCNNT